MAEQSVVMSSEQIAKILPHRFPFLLVDRVIAKEPGSDDKTRQGQKVTAIKSVTINEPFFPGHFPEKPVMPGVLLVEAMAQAGALAFYRDGDPTMDVAIAFIKDAKFRRPVIPGDQLQLKAEIAKDRGTMILLKCEAYVDGHVVAEAEILAAVNLKQVQ